MSGPGWLKKVYWNRFAKPAEDRVLFQLLSSKTFSSILEVGLGDGQRMRRIAKLVQLPEGTEKLRFIASDEFEASPAERKHLSLKQAHQITNNLGFNASLIPGDVSASVPRIAHKMGTCDLIIADGSLDPADPYSSFLGGWLDRLMHSETLVVACRDLGQELVLLDAESLASHQVSSQQRAA